jgi:hypothetical protein
VLSCADSSMRLARVSVAQARDARPPFCSFVEMDDVKTVADVFSDVVDRAKSSRGAAWDGVWELTMCTAWSEGSNAALPPDTAMDVPSRLWSTVAREFDCKYFAFTCKGEEMRGQRRDASDAGLQNAFDKLMAPKRSVVVMAECDHADAKPFQFRAWQKIVGLLADTGCSFTSVENKDAAISPLWKLCAVLGALDGHWEKMFVHSLEHDVKGFGDLARLGLADRAAPVYRTAEEAKDNHHTGSLTQLDLQKKEEALMGILSLPLWRLPKWETVSVLFRVVLVYVRGYCGYLKQQAGARQENRQFLDQNRPAIVAGRRPVVYHSARVTVDERYEGLDGHMERQQMWEIVDLVPFTERSTPRQRFEFISGLQLSQCFAHYTYSYGGRKKSLNLIWLTDEDQIENAKQEDFMLTQCSMLTQQYYTQKIQRRLVKALDDLCGSGLSKEKVFFALRSVGIVIDDHYSDKDNFVWLMGLSDKEREEHILHGGDLTEPKKTSFVEFYDIVAEKLLGGHIGVNATDRRHSASAVVDVAPIARSVRGMYNDLTDHVQSRGLKIGVPSWPHFFYSFQAPHPGRVSRHTGRLPFRLLQSHKTLRVDNQDGHWVAALWRDTKLWASQSEWRVKIDVFAHDDKALVQCGPPGISVRALQGPQHPTVQHVGAVSNAADHDAVGRSSFVPSVTLRIDMPDEAAGSWCTGSVALTIKDSTLDSSSPLRHLAESFDKNRALGVDMRARPIQLHFADGGADHHIGHAKVQLAWLMYFLHYSLQGLDCVICLRCAGGLSWVNPAERVMAALNLGLYGVSLSRDALTSAVMEKRLGAVGGNKARRQLLTEEPGLRAKWSEAIARPRKEVCELMAQVEYSEEKVKVVPVGDSSGIIKGLTYLVDSLFRINYDSATGKSLLANADYQAFCADHIVSTPYTFVIVKCGKMTCRFNGCHQQTLTPYALQRVRATVLSWPHPVADPEREGHYKPATMASFATGTERASYNAPSSLYSDSLLLARSDTNVAPYLKKANILADVVCIRCRKPRLIYASSKRGTDKKALLKDVDGVFRCGSNDVVDASFAWKAPDGAKILCFTHPGLTCGVPMEPDYYSFVWPSKKKGGSSAADKRLRYPLCYACGARVDSFVIDPKVEKPANLPLCERCSAAGRSEVPTKMYKLKKGEFDSVFD